MKIRSITYFCNPGWPLNRDTVQTAATFIKKAQPAFEDVGFEVQSNRLAIPPFPTLLPDLSSDVVNSFAKVLETEANNIGFDYVSIGPALPDIPESYRVVPAVIASTKNTFASAVMASHKNGISLPAVKACAEIVHKLSNQDPNGFANLYFAALGNVSAGAPFFPAAYHEGSTPAFSIATEAADLAVTAFSESGTLLEARQNLTEAVETGARKIIRVADELGMGLNLRFFGIDYSLAPFPETALSLGTAMESLGGMQVGRHGSLAASAFIADTIDKAIFPHIGFCGMMLPLLEDATLSKRGAQGTLSIKDLLLYATVCGTGLDTIPLPGDTTIEELSALLLDLACLSMRLDKPLTARLMPIPGKKAGDPTDFDFPFFSNSRILSLESDPLGGLLAGEESFQLNSR